MDSLISHIPRLGEVKTKPKIGEVRLTLDGTRRKVFDGRCWQYLCIGDPNCRIQAKLACRYHRAPDTNDDDDDDDDDNDASIEKSPDKKTSQPKTGETQTLPNGNRRVWRGARWHSLCRAEECPVQARDFCKTHQNQRMSLPNSIENTAEKSPSSKRTRSLTLNHEKENEHNQSQDDTSLEISTDKPCQIDENTLNTLVVSPTQKRELHTRNGRRVRCNGLIWKHLCADKKTNLYKRKYQRQSLPIKKTDSMNEPENNISNETSLPSSDINHPSIETSPIKSIKSTRKRKITGDLNNEEHIVPKRKNFGRKRKGSNKSLVLSLEPTSTNTSMSDLPMKDKSIEEPVLNEDDVSSSLKTTHFNTHSQSIEIPVQPSFFNFESSSPSAILEQFGTIIKKEAEDEPLVCAPAMSTNGLDYPCETLQDFLRVEEIKKKEFKLDCQRISYRLAKIQDCIGNISSITS